MEKDEFWRLIAAASLTLVAVAFFVATHYYIELAQAYKDLALCQTAQFQWVMP